MGPDTTHLLIGITVGFASAIIGAFVDYLVSRRRENRREARLPGCMFLVTGGLGFVGTIVIVASYFLTGWIRPALMAGIGVLGGFSLTFMALILTWLYTNRYSPQDANVIDNS